MHRKYRVGVTKMQYIDGLSRWVPLSRTCVQYRPGDTASIRSNRSYAMQLVSPQTDSRARYPEK